MTALHLVLDTNVLVSALVYGGLPAEILQLGLDRHVVFVTSAALLEELERVLHLKFPHIPPVTWQALESVREIMYLVTPSETLDIITADPTDNRVLECAVFGKARIIISGDKHLLRLKEFRDIQIFSPKDFLHKYPF